MKGWGLPRKSDKKILAALKRRLRPQCTHQVIIRQIETQLAMMRGIAEARRRLDEEERAMLPPIRTLIQEMLAEQAGRLASVRVREQ